MDLWHFAEFLGHSTTLFRDFMTFYDTIYVIHRSFYLAFYVTYLQFTLFIGHYPDKYGKIQLSVQDLIAKTPL